jgi:hypothetical protein
MKTLKEFTTYSIDKGNAVILTNSVSTSSGKQVIVSEEEIVQLPLMYATERNQMVHFVKRLTPMKTELAVYSISKEFNKIRRTFLRDIAKVQRQPTPLVELVKDEDNKDTYIYKAYLLKEEKPQ